jgi:hypothetical protein
MTGEIEININFICWRNYFPAGFQGAKYNLKNDMILMITAVSGK